MLNTVLSTDKERFKIRKQEWNYDRAWNDHYIEMKLTCFCMLEMQLDDRERDRRWDSTAAV